MNSNGHYISTHARAIAPMNEIKHETDVMIYTIIIAVICGHVYSCIIAITDTLASCIYGREE
jgi:hypothetical protein